MASKKNDSNKKNSRRINAQSPTRGGTKRSRRKKPSARKRSSSNAGGWAGLKERLSNLSWPDFKRPSLPSRPSFDFDLRRQAIVVGMILVLSMLLTGLSLLSANQGVIMGAIIGWLWYLFGWGVPPMIAAVTALGAWLIAWGIEKPFAVPPIPAVGGVLLFITFESFATLISVMRDNGYGTFAAVREASLGGGLLGSLCAQLLMGLGGVPAAVLVLTVLGLTAAVMVSGVSRDELAEMFVARRQQKPQPQQGNLPLLDRRRKRPSVSNGRSTSGTASSSSNGRTKSGAVEAWSEPAPPSPDAADAGQALTAQQPLPADTVDEDGSTTDAADDEEAKRQGIISRLRRRMQAADKKEAATAGSEPEPVFAGREGDGNWQMPQPDQLLELGHDHSAEDTHMHQQALVIEETLASFGAPSQVVDINYGPTIIQYCVEPSYIVQRSGKRTKVKVGKIANLADDLALALAARSVRVQAPVPGKAYVGIEVPNEATTLVSLRDVMESATFGVIAEKSSLAIGLGEDVSGHPISVDLAKMPHMLIAGATGSGKSVCINAIIACFLLQNTPEDLKLVMVDPKRVELTGYNGIPHLAAPVVVDMDRVVGTLQWALKEMDKRYMAFAQIGARNIGDYNRKMVPKGHKKLPYVVIIIDELADLMMMAPEETERSIARLAQMARATGIHMILATQRPSVDVVTGLIKANFPARIAFAVASSTDSRVVLDTTGAERLLGQGDMLFQSPDAPAPVRMQGCFVSDRELNKLIDYWKQERYRTATSGGPGRQVNLITPDTDAMSKEMLDADNWDTDTPEEKREKKEALQRIIAESNETAPEYQPSHLQGKPTTPGERINAELQAAQKEAVVSSSRPDDDLWEDAVQLIVDRDRASTTMLQREFRIGYTRAARLIDAMEEEGLIGPPTGSSKAREVLVTDNEGDDKDADK